MIDLDVLRNETEKTISLLKKKDPSFDAELLFDLDEDLRLVRVQVEDFRKQKNDLAREGKTGVTPELRAKSVSVGKRLQVKEVELKALETKFHELYLSCPNIPLDDVPVGDKSSNVVIKNVGNKRDFSFPIKNHVELGESLGWLDFQAAAKITGNNFAFYQGDAAKLLYTLSMFMLKNNMKHGYEPIVPPVLVNEKSLEVSGNFPKFKEQVYSVPGDHLYLTPTSEVDLANRYRDHIFSPDELPVRMTTWTNCFRREAGAYGSTERGLIRIHQFDKVELYTICEPDNSANELDRMIACAQEILQKLDLHYRVSLLASQDCSFQAAKTYDIEVWLPGQQEYYEVSSVSNCTDFQSRRGLMRYRQKEVKKTKLVHTLNASSLALPRLLVALMEVYQQEDGSITIPDALKNEGLFDYASQ